MTEPDQNNSASELPVLPGDPAKSLRSSGAETLSSPPDALSLASLAHWNIGTNEPEVESLEAPALPSFELVRLVAKGGCGEVWEARQKSLERVVAVKKIQEENRTQAATSKIQRWRLENEFRIEALATSRLDHPNIVPVYDFGIDNEGWPLMAMKLVKGDPWHHILRRDFESLPLGDYLSRHLSIFLTMMQAVAFAHSRKIVHRDLKPSQVMVGEFGEVLLMDWGFAVYVGDEPDALSAGFAELPTPQTASNPSGTPFFMAPEQTTRSAENISTLTDIYLLGSTLYFLLTANYPHRASSSEQAIEHAATQPAIPIVDAAGTREVPSELANIAMHALEADPARRIQTVAEFIKRIENYLSGASDRKESQQLVAQAQQHLIDAQHATASSANTETTYQHYVESLTALSRAAFYWAGNPALGALRQQTLHAYVESAILNDDLTLAKSHLPIITDIATRLRLMERIDQRTNHLRRQAVQRRAAFTMAAVLVVAQIIGFLIYIQAQKNYRQRIEQQRDVADDARERAQTFRIQAEQARTEAIEQKQIAEVARTTAESEQYYANISLAGTSIEQGRIEKAADLLLNKTPPAFRNWEWGRMLAEAHGESMIIGREGSTHATYSPDGTIIYTGDREGRVSAWSATTGALISERRVHNGRIWEIEITNDGKRMVTASFDKVAILSDAATGEIIRKYVGHTDLLRGVSLSPDNKLMLTVSQDQTARIWDVETGSTLRILSGFKGVVYHGCFSPDGTRVVTACRDSSVRISDVATGEKILELEGHPQSVLCANYSADGTRIVTACTDRNARIYDANTGALIRTLENVTSYLHYASFSHDGKLVITTADDGINKVWNADTGVLLAQLLNDSPTWKVTFSPDDKHVVFCSAHSVRMWDLHQAIDPPVKIVTSPAKKLWETPENTARIFGLTRGRDPSWQEREKKWNFPEGRTLIESGGKHYAIDSHFTAFSPDATSRIDIDPDTYFGTVRDAHTGEKILDLGRQPLFTALYSPDGKYAAVIRPIDYIEIYDTASWTRRALLQMDPDRKIKVAINLYIIASAAFSPDSKYLAVPYLNDLLVMWDMETGKPLYETKKSFGFGPCISYNHDGTKFAIAGNDDRITLWNASDGHFIRSFVGHTRPVCEVDFNPTGDRLVSYSRDLSVKLWDTDSGREIYEVFTVNTNDTILSAHFTKSGDSIFVATASGIFKVLEAFPWKPEDYPGDDSMPLQTRIELWKRRHRLSPDVSFSDIAVSPANQTSEE